MPYTFSFYLPTKIIFRRGSFNELGKETKSLGDRAIFVCGRRFAQKSGYLDRAKKLLEKEGIRVTVFNKVEPNPSFETVEKGAELAKKERINVVIGFGGGSAMDAAKGIAVLVSQGGKITDYIFPNEVRGSVIPIIAVPTTCGTGSEVTRYAVFSDLKNKKKTTMLGYPIIPRVSILDSEVLNYLPPSLTAYTAFDALSHAMEAYLSKASQPLSDLVALESIRVIFENLEKAYKGDLDAREKIFYASMLAGIAINCTGTIIVHGMGYYLTMYHDVHHGLANALLLPFALEYLAPSIPEKIVKLAKTLGISKDDPSLDAETLFNEICRLENSTGIPRSLRDVGVIDEKEIDVMTEEALTYKRNLLRSPREPSKEDLRTIYLKAFRGRPI